MKRLRQYIRNLLTESEDAIAKIEDLMKGGDIDMGIELALSMGIPLEEIPWQAEYNTLLPEVRAQGIEAIIKYLMSRSNLQKPGGWHHPNKNSFKQVFAIADELGMTTQDLPWDVDSVGDFMEDFGYELAQSQKKAHSTKSGLLSSEEIDAKYDKFLEPTGWTIAKYQEEVEKQPWYAGKLSDVLPVKEAVATRKNLYLDRPNQGRGYWSNDDVTWTGEDAVEHIYNWYKDMKMISEEQLRSYIRKMIVEQQIEKVVQNYYVSKLEENLGLNSSVLAEAITHSDRIDIKKMVKKDILQSRDFKVQIDKSFKKNFDKELQKTLGVSYFGTPGKVNKFVVDEIHDEVGKILKDAATRIMIGDICKKVIIQLYKQLSFSYPAVIKRIKV